MNQMMPAPRDMSRPRYAPPAKNAAVIATSVIVCANRVRAESRAIAVG